MAEPMVNWRHDGYSIPPRTTSYAVPAYPQSALGTPSRVLSTLRQPRIVKPPPTTPKAMAPVQTYDEASSTKIPTLAKFPTTSRIPVRGKGPSRIPVPVPKKKPPDVLPVSSAGSLSRTPQLQKTEARSQQLPQQHRPMLRRKKSNRDLKLVSDMQLTPPPHLNTTVRSARGLSIVIPDHAVRSSSHVGHSNQYNSHTSFFCEDEPPIVPRHSSRTPQSEISATPSLMMSYSATPSTASSRYTPPVSRSPNFLGFPSYALAREHDQKIRAYQEHTLASQPPETTHADAHPMFNAPYYMGSGVVDPSSTLASVASIPATTNMSHTAVATKSHANVPRLALVTDKTELLTIPPTVIRPPELAHLERPLTAEALHLDSPERDPNFLPGAPPRPSREGVTGLEESDLPPPAVTKRLSTSAISPQHIRQRSLPKEAQRLSEEVSKPNPPTEALHMDFTGSVRRVPAPLSMAETSTSKPFAAQAPPLLRSTTFPAIEIAARHSNDPHVSAASTSSSSSAFPALRKVASKFGLFPRTKDETRTTRTTGSGLNTQANRRPSTAGGKPHRLSSGPTSGAAADILQRSFQPVYLRNVDGNIVVGNRSSSNSENTWASQASSHSSADTSMSSIQAWKNLSGDASRRNSRGAILRGRGGSFSGSTHSETQRKLSKPLTPNLSQPPLPSSGTSPVYRPNVEPISHPSRHAPSNSADRQKKSKFGVSLFSRGSSSRPKAGAQEHQLTLSQLTAYARPPPKPVAHYLDIDLGPSLSSEDTAGIEELAQLMQEASGSEPSSLENSSAFSQDSSPLATVPISLLASPQQATHSNAAPPVGRPTRLFPVGRIPQVVRGNHHQQTRSNESFTHLFPTPPSMLDERMRSDTTSTIPFQFSDEDDNKENEIHFNPHDDYPQKPSGFMTIRQDSDYSYSSSSGGFYYPTLPTLEDGLSVNSPASPDEEWTEYDDYLAGLEGHGVRASHTAMKRPAPSAQTDYFGPQDRPSKKTSVDMQQSITSGQKMGEISVVFKPDLSPFAGTELRKGFPVPQDSTVAITSRRDAAAATILSNDASLLRKTSSRSSSHSHVTALQPRSRKNSSSASMISLDTAVMDALASFEDSSLQLAALKVSKWLTFGRVLFSPAHTLYENTQVEKILVVDGLGKDWALFCAQSYPNAAVTGLGPAPRFRNFPASRPKKFVHHDHRIELGVSFPYPKHSFDVVVFRFPKAMDERNLLFAIEECNRVLRPGGFLESTLIDIELANVGPQARKATKELKTRMQSKDGNLCLKTTSDNIQSMVGKCNFENINHCTIAVPVAGSVASSNSSQRNSESSGSSIGARMAREQTDEDITKLVAKVGRWWYTECYERAAMATKKDKSIWSNADLLRECTQQGTAFKLFVCYAQKALGERQTSL